jgi:predicted Zn finger-like uncharacterized protein
MQIICPACAATYEVPMTLLKPGKAVRCARCAGEWVPSPAAPEVPMDVQPQAAPAAAPAPEFVAEVIRPPRRPPMPRPLPPRPNMAPRIAWAASVAVVLLLGWGAYAERTMIMQIWPPSIRLYAALGLTAGH